MILTATSQSSEAQKQRWRSRVDRSFHEIAEQILQYYPGSNSYSTIEKTAALHQYVYHKIGFEARFNKSPSRPFRSPNGCLQAGKGNCQEKSILVASLLTGMQEIKARTVALTREGGNSHRILEIHFPYPPEIVCDTIRDFYDHSSKTTDKPRRIAFFRDWDKTYTWIVADTGTRYLGSLDHLSRLGYVVFLPEPKWDYYQLESRYELKI